MRRRLQELLDRDRRRRGVRVRKVSTNQDVPLSEKRQLVELRDDLRDLAWDLGLIL